MYRLENKWTMLSQEYIEIISHASVVAEFIFFKAFILYSTVNDFEVIDIYPLLEKVFGEVKVFIPLCN